MNNTQIDKPGLLHSQEQQANPISPIQTTRPVIVNSLEKVKNCPLTKFLSELNSKKE